jgi:hypothetical protein
MSDQPSWGTEPYPDPTSGDTGPDDLPPWLEAVLARQAAAFERIATRLEATPAAALPPGNAPPCYAIKLDEVKSLPLHNGGYVLRYELPDDHSLSVRVRVNGLGLAVPFFKLILPDGRHVELVPGDEMMRAQQIASRFDGD